MSRKLIWIVTLLMGLAMTTLIIFQAYWIRNAIHTKEEQFDQLVGRSLIDIAYELEWHESERLIHQELDPLLADSGSIIRPPAGESGIRNMNGNESLFPGADTDVPSNRQNSGREIDGNRENNSNTPTRSNNRRENGSLEQNSQSDLAGWITNQEEFIKRYMIRRIRLSPFIEERLSQVELVETIEDVFKSNGIQDLNFEYAVLRPDNEIAIRSTSFSITEPEYFDVQLFPGDMGPKNILKIYFPQRNNSMFESLGYMAFSSIVLSLIIVVVFTLAVYVLFRQKRLSDIRNDFVSNMTHELKTPISTISLASQMLGDKSIAWEVKNPDQIAKIIGDECRRLGTQVEKVLQTAIFDKGKLKLRLQEIDMHEIIMVAIENFSFQVRSRNGTITSSLKAKNSDIYADQVHITNVLSNLIDNAIKYCTRDPEIHIETSDKGSTFSMIIKDNGTGISKNDQKRIFEKFYRVPTGNIHTVKGFGLGLSYVKMIVEAHQGKIDLESELYKGSKFNIILPVKAKE